VVVAGWGARAWWSSRTDYSRISHAWKNQKRRLDAETRQQLNILRALSLTDDMPVEAQVDLWTKLDKVEIHLDQNKDDESKLAEIVSSVEKLLPKANTRDTKDALADLSSTATRAGASLQETRRST
jgi:hypothetical protein